MIIIIIIIIIIMYLFHYITHLLDGDGYIFIEKYNFLF